MISASRCPPMNTQKIDIKTNDGATPCLFFSKADSAKKTRRHPLHGRLRHPPCARTNVLPPRLQWLPCPPARHVLPHRPAKTFRPRHRLRRRPRKRPHHGPLRFTQSGTRHGRHRRLARFPRQRTLRHRQGRHRRLLHGRARMPYSAAGFFHRSQSPPPPPSTAHASPPISPTARTCSPPK